MYVLDDHDQEGQFDSQGLAFVLGTGDEGSGDVGAHDLQHRRLDVLIRDSLYVPVLD